MNPDFFFNNHVSGSEYSVLDPQRLLHTLEKLQIRIDERFPGSGLGKVTTELKEVATAITSLVQRLPHPLWPIRLMTVAAIVLMIGLTAWLVSLIMRYIPAGESGLMEVLQGAESATNEVIFLSLAILFFATLENRIKRRAALRSLHRLRSLAHVVDMHQLTKDPTSLLSSHQPTAASPERTLTAYQLTRYLDYCSELLAIISKLAALHVQSLQDNQVLETVNDVENLCQGLSGKIWQKIMILDMYVSGTPSRNLPGSHLRPRHQEGPSPGHE